MKNSISFFVLFFLIVLVSCNKEEINELEKKNQDLIEQTTRLQEQISTLTTEVNNLTNDVSNLSLSNDVLSSSNNELLNKVTLLQITIDELDEELNNMTNDYEQAELENSDLYDEYLSIVNSRNELQAQLDNLVNEINSTSCPPIEYTNSNMVTEQLFCTSVQIDPISFDYDDSAYEFSFIQDSIPNGITILKTPGNIRISGTPYSDQKDLFSFDLKFTSDQCEEVKRITLARSPNSPTISLVSGSNIQSIASGNQIEAIEYSFGGSKTGERGWKADTAFFQSVEDFRYQRPAFSTLSVKYLPDVFVLMIWLAGSFTVLNSLSKRASVL